jgi:hypothetical protein
LRNFSVDEATPGADLGLDGVLRISLIVDCNNWNIKQPLPPNIIN